MNLITPICPPFLVYCSVAADGSSGWTRQPVLSDADVQIVDKTRMPYWAVGLDRNDGSSILLRRFPGLGPFERIVPPSWNGNTIAEIHGTDDGNNLVAIEDTNSSIHCIFGSTDNGQSWSKVSPEFPPPNWFVATDIASSGSSVVVTGFSAEQSLGVDRHPVLLHSSIGGQDLSILRPVGMDRAIPLAVSISNDKTAFIVGRTDTVGEIWRSTGKFTQCTSTMSLEHGARVDIAHSRDTILASGINQIQISTDRGSSWNTIPLPEGGHGARYAAIIPYRNGLATIGRTTNGKWTVFAEHAGKWEKLGTLSTTRSSALIQKTRQGILAVAAGGERLVQDNPTSIVDRFAFQSRHAIVVKRGQQSSVAEDAASQFILYDHIGKSMQSGSLHSTVTPPIHVPCGEYCLKVESTGTVIVVFFEE